MIIKNIDKFDIFLRKVIRSKLEYRDGIYFAKNTSKTYYPEEGHKNIFQIEDNSFWFKHRNNCIIEVINNFPPPGIILDLGGGNGFVSLYVKKNGYEVAILESGVDGMLNAKRRGLKKLICANFNQIKFYPNSIPAVGIFDVLEYVEEDFKFLKNIQKSLIKEGKLYITVPAYSFLYSDEDNQVGNLRRYTLNFLKTMINQAGLKIEYSTYFFSILPLPIFLFRTLPNKLRLRQSNPKKIENEHKERDGISGTLLQSIWNTELKIIVRKGYIPFGGSCLLVAKK